MERLHFKNVQIWLKDFDAPMKWYRFKGMSQKRQGHVVGSLEMNESKILRVTSLMRITLNALYTIHWEQLEIAIGLCRNVKNIKSLLFYPTGMFPPLQVDELRMRVRDLEERERKESKKLADEDALRKIRVAEETIEHLQKKLAATKQVRVEQGFFVRRGLKSRNCYFAVVMSGSLQLSSSVCPSERPLLWLY